VRVLLVQPPHRDTFGYSMPPLGPLHLAATARRRGHEPLFLDLALLLRRGELCATDPELMPRCAERVLQARPQAVGITSMVSSLPAALHLAACVRRRAPDVPLILGGQGPEQIEHLVLARHPAVDAVAVGEADESFSDWLDVLQRGGDPASVPGLVLRRGCEPLRTPARPPLADLNRVDSPAWDLAESPAAYAAAAGGGEALFPIDLGRGCTFVCSFCTTPIFWGRQARQLSPARAADEFDRLAALEGIDCAYVTHDLFTADRTNVLAICAEKRARGNTLAWECRTRLDLVDEQLLTALAHADCRRILYGVESDSPRVLELVNKGGRAATLDVRGRLAMASRVGMASIVGVMAGVPGESAADVEANLTLMAQLAVIDGVSLSLHWFNVLPGNGQAGALGESLVLRPGVHADLVRGHDLTPGQVPPEQAQMIADDPELFVAFRVFAQPWAEPEALHLLTRNAHLLLEVLPRSLRALAHARGETLLSTLLSFLVPAWRQATAPSLQTRPDASSSPSQHVQPRASDAQAACMAPLLADERRQHGEPFVEPRVLDRAAGVRLAAAWARAHDDEQVNALVSYERALFETERTQLLRLPRDPVPLVRSMDANAWPPDASPPRPRAVLFVRRGDAVRAHGLSALLADVFECSSDSDLAGRRPELSPSTREQARRLLEQLTHTTRR